MTKVNFAETRKQAEAEGLIGGGDIYKVQEGDNRIRLMSECIGHEDEFKSKDGTVRRTFKWLCYVIDRRDGQVKPYFMPHKIYTLIEALQLNPDYQFDEVPMPYDVTIGAKGAGTKEVVYSVVPARQNTPLTVEELKQVEGMKSIREFQKQLNKEAGPELPAAVTPAPQERPAFNPANDIQIAPGDMSR